MREYSTGMETQLAHAYKHLTSNEIIVTYARIDSYLISLVKSETGPHSQ